jgi:glycosyltransferase involved in cell wall biosynthesis
MLVSVIITTRNRASLLGATLEHLSRQKVGDASWELLVVDNASTDGTAAVLARPPAGLPLVPLQEPRLGKNIAVNQALERARGDLLVFTDDDVIPAPQWIAELVAASRRWPHAEIFGGQTLIQYPDGTPEWLKTPWHGALNFARYSLSQPEGPTRHLPHGPNFAVRAQALADLRFREDIGPQGNTEYAMGSETELLRRVLARGAQIIYVPSATLLHVVQPQQLEPASLYRRAFRFGRGEVRKGERFTEPGVTLCGAPHYLWGKLLYAAIRYSVYAFAGRQRRFEAGLQFHHLRGALHERRALARAGGRGAPVQAAC